MTAKKFSEKKPGNKNWDKMLMDMKFSSFRFQGFFSKDTGTRKKVLKKSQMVGLFSRDFLLQGLLSKKKFLAPKFRTLLPKTFVQGTFLAVTAKNWFNKNNNKHF